MIVPAPDDHEARASRTDGPRSIYDSAGDGASFGVVGAGGVVDASLGSATLAYSWAANRRTSAACAA